MGFARGPAMTFELTPGRSVERTGPSSSSRTTMSAHRSPKRPRTCAAAPASP